MPLTQDQENLEHELRTELLIMSIEQAKVNIEQMRLNSDKLRSDLRYESRKFAVQLVAGLSTAFAAGVAVFGLVLRLMGKL